MAAGKWNQAARAVGVVVIPLAVQAYGPKDMTWGPLVWTLVALIGLWWLLTLPWVSSQLTAWRGKAPLISSITVFVVSGSVGLGIFLLSSRAMRNSGSDGSVPSLPKPTRPIALTDSPVAPKETSAKKPENPVSATESKPAQTPNIRQHSEGANSPNIVGNNNQVNVNTPRDLTAGQGKAIADQLIALPPQEIVFTAYMSSDDGAAYGAQIGNAVLAGGWKVRGNAINRSISTAFDVVNGVAILVSDQSHPPDAAIVLAAALKAAGIAAPIMRDASLPNGTVVLWIGSR